MKAAVLKTFGAPLALETWPDPVLRGGEVIVDIAAAPVLPYADEIFSGARKYPFGLPAIPGAGAIGRIRAKGPDSTRLAIGDWVICDPTIRSRDDVQTPDIALQGLSARGDGGMRLQENFPDGSFAEQMRTPTENVTRIGAIHPGQAGRYCALTLLMVPFGGLLAARLQPGETLLVSGATGSYGSAAILLALAMGAGRIIAPGRNEAALAGLARRFGTRLKPVKLTGDGPADREAMQKVAGGPVDCVLDLLPPAASAQTVRTAAMTVREFGTIVLMGGVGMLGGEDLALPYAWIMRNNITLRGQWMFPRDAPGRLIGLLGSGALSLEHFEITAFPLDQANEAVAHAAAHAAPFQMTIIQP